MLQVLGKVVEAALFVGGQSDVDHLGISQSESLHHLDKFFLGFGQPGNISK